MININEYRDEMLEKYGSYEAWAAAQNNGMNAGSGSSGGSSGGDGGGNSSSGGGGSSGSGGDGGGNSSSGSGGNDTGMTRITTATSTAATNSTAQVTSNQINDGITVNLFGNETQYVDLSTGAYGTAININAAYSAGINALYGNYAANTIAAGAGANYLWGGADFADDVLVGGLGSDVFLVGKANGSDTILNSSAFDTVALFDVTLSDIVAAYSDGMGTIALQFNTGNVVAVSGTDLISATFALADGSRYAFNNVTQSWQPA